MLLAAGLDGLYTHDTAGEFYNLTDEEHERVNQRVAEVCESRVHLFQLGVSDPSPTRMLQRLRRIKPLNPGAIQIIPPDWFPLADAELRPFLDRMAAEAAPIGLVLYNPLHAKRVLGPEQLGRLGVEVDGLVGVKVVGGDATWFAALRRHSTDLSAFVSAHHLATGVQRGAQGSYSNVACLNPTAATRWYRQILDDPTSKLELERRVQ